MLQDRNGAEVEVPNEERSNNSTPSPTARGNRVAGAPKRVSQVVDVSAQTEQATLVYLALVLGIFLENVPLDLRAELQRHAESVQRRADNQRSLREALAVGGSGGLRADEEERVERVEDSVEGANHETGIWRHLLLHDGRAVEVLLQHTPNGHAEDNGPVWAQTKQAVERRVGDESWALRQDLTTDLFDDIAAEAFGEDAILKEGIKSA